jgi:hypothetical protein
VYFEIQYYIRQMKYYRWDMYDGVSAASIWCDYETAERYTNKLYEALWKHSAKLWR